jgi:DNA transformation protein
MAASAEFREFVIEQVSVLGPVRIRAMFGGAGIFLHDVMFGLIADDVLYFKADDTTVPRFEAEGMTAFTYDGRGKVIVMPYWIVPDRLFDDADEMTEWARQAYDVALKTRKS